MMKPVAEPHTSPSSFSASLSPVPSRWLIASRPKIPPCSPACSSKKSTGSVPQSEANQEDVVYGHGYYCPHVQRNEAKEQEVHGTPDLGGIPKHRKGVALYPANGSRPAPSLEEGDEAEEIDAVDRRVKHARSEHYEKCRWCHSWRMAPWAAIRYSLDDEVPAQPCASQYTNRRTPTAQTR